MIDDLDPQHAILRKLKAMTRGRRGDAIEKGWPVDDDIVDFAVRLFHAQRGRCSMTGITFNLDIHGSG